MDRVTRGVPDESRKVYWLLDEFAHIGSVPAIEEAVTLKRGMGIRLWFIFQSLGQLKTCFGDKATEILDNIGTQQYFGIKSYETAEEISKRAGDATIVIESENDTSGYSHSTGNNAQSESGNRSASSAITRSEIARRLLKPEEVLTIDKSTCIIFHSNLPVCLGRLVRFYEAPEFRRLWFGFGPRGTAAPRRLGLVAAVTAAFTLLASTLATAVALVLAGVASPPPSAMPDLPDGVPGMQAMAIPQPPVTAVRPVPVRRPVPAQAGMRHRPHPRHRSSESGHLIKIE